MSKYWSTQPIKSDSSQTGTIKEFKQNEIKQTPYDLPDGLTWKPINIQNDLELLHEFFLREYVNGPGLRVAFSQDFIKWVLTSPGSCSKFHVGIADSDRLVGFIAAIPATCRIGEASESSLIKLAEISFLCVDRRYRSRGLTPILSAEITRRLNLKGIFHGIFMANDVLCDRLVECEYLHRQLNPVKLMDLGITRTKKSFNIFKDPKKQTARLFSLKKKLNLQKLNKRDVEQAREFVNSLLEKFHVSKFYTSQEFRWFFLPRNDVYTFIEKSGDEITDFISFYVNQTVEKDIKVAYLVQCLSSRDQDNLLNDTLALASEVADTFTCLNTSEIHFKDKFKFERGEKINYYLFNWNCRTLSSNELAYPLF